VARLAPNVTDLDSLTSLLLSLLENDAHLSPDGWQMPVRSFDLLREHAAGLSGQEKAKVWGTLAQRIHAHFSGWNASGPYVLADGATAYWGGTPKGYVVIFRADGGVFFTKQHHRPGSEWMPDYNSLRTLDDYVMAQRGRADHGDREATARPAVVPRRRSTRMVGARRPRAAGSERRRRPG
jgi:hypothetical protein